MTNIPIWVLAIPAIAVICDSIVVIGAATVLLKRIKKTQDDLESTAKVSVSLAAEDVKDAILGLMARFGIPVSPNDQHKDELEQRRKSS